MLLYFFVTVFCIVSLSAILTGLSLYSALAVILYVFSQGHLQNQVLFQNFLFLGIQLKLF
jgi:hypothetical protein